MRLAGLFVTLSIIAMLGLTLMLATLSANAYAELLSADKSTSRDTKAAPVTQSHLHPAETDAQLMSARKRQTSRCARVTTTCWASR